MKRKDSVKSSQKVAGRITTSAISATHKTGQQDDQRPANVVLEPAPPNPNQAHGNRYTYEQVKEALEINGGMPSQAARTLGCSLSTVLRWMEREPELKAVQRDAAESLVDLAEIALKRRILTGDTTAIIFTLKTQGKNRGWAERLELSGPDGGPVKVMSLSAVFNLSAEDKPLDPFE
jgi:hypothetical protein